MESWPRRKPWVKEREEEVDEGVELGGTVSDKRLVRCAVMFTECRIAY